MTDISQHALMRIDQAHQRLDKHDARLTSLETHTAVAAERAENIKKSLEKIEGGQTWIIRLISGAIIGGIISGLIALVMKGGF